MTTCDRSPSHPANGKCPPALYPIARAKLLQYLPLTIDLPRNFNYKDFKLRSDAPAFLKYLVRPSGLVVATRLGYEITVSGSLATTLDTHFKQTTTVNAGFSIFGTSIWGASVSKTDERNTHSATYDAASRTLKVVPRDNFGAATLLGVAGERISI